MLDIPHAAPNSGASVRGLHRTPAQAMDAVPAGAVAVVDVRAEPDLGPLDVAGGFAGL